MPIRPGREALRVSQDRITEKDFLSGLGLGVAPYAQVDDRASPRRCARFDRHAVDRQDASVRLRRQGAGPPRCARRCLGRPCGDGRLSGGPRGLRRLRARDLGDCGPRRRRLDRLLHPRAERTRRGNSAHHDRAGRHRRGHGRRGRPDRHDDPRCPRLRRRPRRRTVPHRRRAARERDRSQGPQLRPLDPERLRDRSVRATRPSRGGVAPRRPLATQRRRDGQPHRGRHGSGADPSRRRRAPPSTSTARPRPSPDARWATSIALSGATAQADACQGGA